MYSEVTCSFCNQTFLKENKHVYENYKLGHRFYCSRKCEGQAKLKRVELICENPSCQKKFTRQMGWISPHNFCSRSCAARYTNVIRTDKRGRKQCLVCQKVIQRHRNYCSHLCWAKAHSKSKEIVLKDIEILATKLGRTPTRRECPQHTICRKLFGSWNNALVQAGLEPHRSLNQRMYKRRICYAKDGHLCNSVSELIIDNWMYEHSIWHRKEVQYPRKKSVADWMIGKDVFVEYFGLAKDSKRYDAAIAKKKKFCRDLGIRLIEIYSKDLFPKVELGSLFQNFVL